MSASLPFFLAYFLGWTQDKTSLGCGEQVEWGGILRR